MTDSTNLSKIKRDKMLETIREIKRDVSDESILENLSLIENELTKKKYGLVWEEHEERVDEELKTKIPSFLDIEEKTIVEDKEAKLNFLLQGDNLHSLYLLKKTHREKVDIIYIDPPYNTGNNDFIYGDEMLNKEDTFKHSKWLSFISKRLSIAKTLLKKQGVIFISIDDNEQAPLKMLCDEIYGEKNFIGIYLKKSKIGGGNDSKFIVKEHEYCLVYSKNADFCYDMFTKHDENYLKRYKEKDDIGEFFWDTFARPGLKSPIIYDIIAPDGTKIKNGWIRSKKRFEQDYSEGRIKIEKNKKGEWSVFFKQYLNINGKKPRSMTMNFGGNIDGKKDLFNIIGNEKAFSYPKPVEYIKTLISTVVVEDPLVLDFFAGSGTTGQAVLEMNKEDGQNRKFILCTNNENDICEKVTYQRIKNFIKGNNMYEKFPANLKYYETTYIPKINTDESSLLENLIVNIKNLIQLENGIEVDNRLVRVYLSEPELDKFTANDKELKECEKVYISSDVLLMSTQKEKFYNNNIEVFIIPEYYFEDEIREVL